jgi:hypothetical protein
MLQLLMFPSRRACTANMPLVSPRLPLYTCFFQHFSPHDTPSPVSSVKHVSGTLRCRESIRLLGLADVESSWEGCGSGLSMMSPSSLLHLNASDCTLPPLHLLALTASGTLGI